MMPKGTEKNKTVPTFINKEEIIYIFICVCLWVYSKSGYMLFLQQNVLNLQEIISL